MRARFAAVAVVAAFAAAVVVVAAAETTANGLPSYTNGYLKWPKINKKPIHNQDPRSGHAGTKNVYTSKRQAGAKYPNGTVVVKTIVEAGAKYVGKVAVMRKERALALRGVHALRPLSEVLGARAGTALRFLPRAGEVERLRVYEAVATPRRGPG